MTNEINMKTTEEFYRNYIDCLNSGNLEQLSDFIQDEGLVPLDVIRAKPTGLLLI